MDISKISSGSGVGRTVSLSPTSISNSEKGDFQNALSQGVNQVNQDLNQANKVSQEFMMEGKHNLHEVMIQLEKADLNFRFMTQVRNKVLDAYNEVMRMQV